MSDRPDTTQQAALVEVSDLRKYFPIKGGPLQRVKGWVKAVDQVSFAIQEGESLGLVGESGCGKTTLGRTVLGLLSPTGGEVRFDGKRVFQAEGRELKLLRREMQIIFQDPFSSLDPRMSVGETIGEGLRIHNIGTKKERKGMVEDMLTKVGLEPYHARRHPHAFSGGQRQRIGIARALALQPRFIVCDEPVSALDVSIQAQVLNLLKDLQKEFDLTYLFIAHDMSVVEHMCDRIAVMYLGKIVELASRAELFRNPLHPYTQALISAIPVANPDISKERIILDGDVPSPANPPSGCVFHPRCRYSDGERCLAQIPPLREVEPGHFAACHYSEAIAREGGASP